MNHIIAVCSRKGGSGKTTTCWALGGSLMKRNKKVLFIDLDAQCNLTKAMGADPEQPNVTDFFDGADAAEVVQHTPNGDIIAGSPYLDAADMILKNNTELKKALARSGLKRDYILLDLPASPGRLTMNALTAATSAIITAKAEPFSYDGIDRLIETIGNVQEANGGQPIIRGIVLTAYEGRSKADKKLLDDFKAKAKASGTKLLLPAIRATSKVREAQLNQQHLIDYAPRSTAAQDYNEIVDRVLKW